MYGISGESCLDAKVKGEDWHDDGGPSYNCEWYSQKKKRCKKYGGKHPWKGLTANDACCACGGGEGEGKALKPVCVDLTLANGDPWHDEGGPKTTCQWYSEKSNRCKKYGSKYPFEEMTASAACCTCGGGIEQANNVVVEEGAETFPITAHLRLFNISVADITMNKQVRLVQALEKVLNLEKGAVKIKKLKDFDVPQRKKKTMINPFEGRRNNNRQRTGPVFNFKPRKAVTNAVDVSFVVRLTEVSVFQLNFKKAVDKRYMRQQIRRRLKTVSRVTIPKMMSGLACMGYCNTATPTKEDGEECYCGQDCLVMGDCCPSFFVVPCLEEKRITFAPTPAGPGDHWAAANQRWNMLDPNQGEYKPIG